MQIRAQPLVSKSKWWKRLVEQMHARIAQMDERLLPTDAVLAAKNQVDASSEAAADASGEVLENRPVLLGQ
ncbi:unnamed protein product, partial [Amoebophrya sp. A25]|eukprot:GSA25T00022312001.1